MKNFYIYTNHTKDDKGKMTRTIRDYLQLKGCICSDHVNDKVEGIIVLGGDGTMLQAAREYVSYHIPMIGVNLGTLGYLAEVDREDIEQALDSLIADCYEIEPRMMLSGIPVIAGECLAPQTALNDIVINRKGALQIINFNIYVNGRLLSTYSADGMIISTPTGSTAYNLSAGGPVVEPMASLILISPICPHSMQNRSIVLSPDDTVTIEIEKSRDGSEQEVEAIFDGSHKVALRTGNKLIIKKSERTTGIVKLSQMSFLEILHRKMSD